MVAETGAGRQPGRECRIGSACLIPSCLELREQYFFSKLLGQGRIIDKRISEQTLHLSLGLTSSQTRQ